VKSGPSLGRSRIARRPGSTEARPLAGLGERRTRVDSDLPSRRLGSQDVRMKHLMKPFRRSSESSVQRNWIPGTGEIGTTWKPSSRPPNRGSDASQMGARPVARHFVRANGLGDPAPLCGIGRHGCPASGHHLMRREMCSEWVSLSGFAQRVAGRHLVRTRRGEHRAPGDGPSSVSREAKSQPCRREGCASRDARDVGVVDPARFSTRNCSSRKSSPMAPTTRTWSKWDAASAQCTAAPPSVRSRVRPGFAPNRTQWKRRQRCSWPDPTSFTAGNPRRHRLRFR
jgi:hypothetical protein